MRRLLALFAVASLVIAAACDGDGDDAVTPTSSGRVTSRGLEVPGRGGASSKMYPKLRRMPSRASGGP